MTIFTESARLTLLGAMLAAALVAFGLFGYLCYRQGQEHKQLDCTCDMVKNRECVR